MFLKDIEICIKKQQQTNHFVSKYKSKIAMYICMHVAP